MRILLVVHGFPPDALGGTEIYTHDLALALERAGNEVTVLAREADPSRPDYAVRRDEQEGLTVHRINYTFRDCASFEGTYRNARIRDLAGRLLNSIRPDIVHFQHLTCLSTDLIAECSRRGLPVFFTLNDYWLICQRGQMFDLDSKRCDGPHRGCTRCADAVAGPAAHRLAPAWRRIGAKLPSALAGPLRAIATALLRPRPTSGPSPEMQRRMDHIRWIASQVNLFLAPSETLRERFLDFGLTPSHVVRVEQGIDQRSLTGIRDARDGQRSGQLRIGYLGSLMVSKAPHVLLEAFAGLPEGVATLEIFGAAASYHGDDSYRQRLEPLLATPGVHHHGAVSHTEIPTALASIDVMVMTSVWLENAPFVIREACVAGVPVVASNLGGMAAMVSHEKDGLLFEPGDAGDLRRALGRLVDEPGLLPRLRSRIPGTMTIDEDAEQLLALYRRPPAAPRRSPRLAAVVLNYRTPHDTLLAVRSLFSSQRPFEDVIVVDNASGDGSVDWLRANLPSTVRLIETGSNLGFSGGCNAGIRAALDAGAARIFLLNSDAIVTRETIGRLEEALETNPGAVIAGPVVLSAHDPSIVATAGMRFSSLTGRMRHLDAGERFDGEAGESHDVAGIAGCAMLLDRVALERVGLLDDDYFFSFEDLAYGLQAQRAGLRAIVVGNAIAYHQGSRSIGPASPSRLYFAARNHLLMARRAAPVNPLLAPFRFASIVGLNLAHAVVTGRPRYRAIRSVLRGIADHLRGRYGNELTAGDRPRR